MPKNRKYHPDYGKLYPGVEIPPDVLAALRQSDRKMKYMEYDLKAERPIKDENGVVIGLLPGREDSLERQMETDKQFMAVAPSPEQVVEEREEMEELHRCLALLTEDERALIAALFFEGHTEQEYAVRIGRKQQSVNERKLRILDKIKLFSKNEFFALLSATLNGLSK